MKQQIKSCPSSRAHLHVAALSILLPVLPACTATGEGHDRFVIHERFEESSKLSMLPHGWVLAETAARGTPASWGRTRGENGHAFAVLSSRNVGQTFNLAILERPLLADFHASLGLKAISGAIDQGGGLCWRLQSPDEYYIARWNPLEDNLRLYIVRNGKRSMLVGRSLKADPSQWHKLEIDMRGAQITVSFDGTAILHYKDTRIEDAGRFGLWTKADAVTAFDDLEVAK